MPNFFDYARFKRRYAGLPFALCVLGMIWILFLLPADHRQSILYPAKTIINSVTSDGRSGEILDLSHLQIYGLTPSFSYRRRTIKANPSHGERPTLTVLIETNLLPESQVLRSDLEDLHNVTLENTLPSLTLYVPPSPKVDTSIMSFGIATSADRIPDAMPQLQHWLPHTESTLLILVPPAPKISQLQQQMRDLHMNSTIKVTSHPFATAYFSLIKELYDARTEKTKWLVLIDDDTFIPSLPALIDHLLKTYKASEEYLLAAISDNIQQIHNFGLIPFGGGGIFISVPLAAKLVQPKIWKACIEIQNTQGDQIVDQCLKAHSSIRPTFDTGLNQMDFQGGPGVAAGYMESGRQMLTIHHWRSWYQVDMPTVGIVTKACGDEGILMRWLFDEDVVLSNGYSIVEYPRGIDTEQLEQVELTWPTEKSKSEHKIGPLRDPMNKKDKRTLLMVDTQVIEGHGVRQTYLEKAEVVDGEVKGEDRVAELVWLF